MTKSIAMDQKVSLFIPIYNASKLLKANLEKIYDALLQLWDNFEIIIIDDNSTDGSFRLQAVVDRINKIEGNQIRYVFYNKGPSRRENLAKSFCLAKYDTIGFLDADLSCDVLYILRAVKLLKEEEADIVIGSRYIKGAKVKRRPLRRAISLFYNLTIRWLFSSKIKDHQCGLKIFLKDSVFPIIAQMGYDEKYVRGWFWDAELLIRAQKAGLKIIEMPVVWHYADSSTFNLRRELRCLRSIIKLKEQL